MSFNIFNTRIADSIHDSHCERMNCNGSYNGHQLNVNKP